MKRTRSPSLPSPPPPPLTWYDLVEDTRRRVQRHLHKMDKLALARTCRLNWAERDKRTVPALTVDDAITYWQYR